MSKGADARLLHLSMLGGGTVHINCDKFAQDFRESYDNGFKPLALASTARMEARLQDMAIQYSAQARRRY